jgi:glycosyltransferase involved in cell wall biosynthesis
MGAELRELVKQLGLSDRVVFCGEIPPPPHVYREPHACSACLREEPFGIVLLEAGAFRCPVVATSDGGVPEIVTDSVSARLVPPDDPAALATQLRALLCDPEECARLSAALFEHVRTRFTWQRAYRSYAALCRPR